MLGKILKYGNDSRESILKGISDVEKAVCSTLGPRGHTVLIDKGTGHPIITKDGVSVAKAISFSDPWKNIGAQLIIGAANKTNHEAGDGTTTATLLTAELAKAGSYLVNKGMDSNEVRYGYEKACEDISKEIEKYKKVISSDDDIKNIATISANNDETVGEVILKAFSGIGEDGVVSLKDSFNGKTDIKFSSGLRYDDGAMNGQYMNTRDDTCEFSNGAVVICDKAIEDFSDLVNILSWSGQADVPLVLIAPSISKDVNAALQDNFKNGAKICPVYAPKLNKALRYEKLLDLAAFFGISILGDEKDEVKMGDFDSSTCAGMFNSIKISMQNCIFDAKENEETLNKRVEELKAQLHLNDNDPETALTEEQKEGLKERIAKLTGGIATIFVGGNSDLEIKERIDRYEDACNAVRAAMSDGIVPGGGTALLKAASKCELNDYHEMTPDFQLGYKTFMSVCKKPAKFIMSNILPEEQVELTAAKIAENTSIGYGFDAKVGELSDDLFAKGIIDPIKVTLCALKYSTSTAALFLTTDSCITDEQNNMHCESTDPILDEYR